MHQFSAEIVSIRCILNADAGTCPQDGGGPLLYNYEGRAVVIGINDRIDKLLHNHKKSEDNDDYDKCKSDVPTEFTHIGLYNVWLRNNFGEKCVAPELIKNKKKLCKCRPVGSRTYREFYRGINSILVENKNDLTYIAHLVKIRYEDENKPPFSYGKIKIYKLFCSGSLINSQWILTAGHCTSYYKMDSLALDSDKANKLDKIFQVGVSLHNLAEIYKNPAYMSTIKSVYIHPFHVFGEAANDLSLIQTDKEFRLGPDYNIWPPCLLDYNLYDYKKDVILQAGFGYVKLKSSFIKPRQLSRKIEYKTLYEKFIIKAPTHDLSVTKNYQTNCLEPHPKLLCIIGKDQGPCNGDSGGPLIWRNKIRNQEYIIAVQSLGFAKNINSTHMIDCLPNSQKETVYLYKYIDWIKSIIGANYCSSEIDSSIE